MNTTKNSDMLGRAIPEASHEIDSLRAQLAAAEAERDRAVKDAERYQCLRKNAHGGTIFASCLPGGALNCDEPESEWDAAIDAAIASAAGEAASS